mmetsp:Transcript_41081/g.113164  ORF Transcript_41081/g.113164 Transcript_41081/m.113164 type:complete len:328 (+) Transcript_41081:687-1670(+)
MGDNDRPPPRLAVVPTPTLTSICAVRRTSGSCDEPRNLPCNVWSSPGVAARPSAVAPPPSAWLASTAPTMTCFDAALGYPRDCWSLSCFRRWRSRIFSSCSSPHAFRSGSVASTIFAATLVLPSGRAVVGTTRSVEVPSGLRAGSRVLMGFGRGSLASQFMAARVAAVAPETAAAATASLRIRPELMLAARSGFAKVLPGAGAVEPTTSHLPLPHGGAAKDTTFAKPSLGPSSPLAPPPEALLPPVPARFKGFVPEANPRSTRVTRSWSAFSVADARRLRSRVSSARPVSIRSTSPFSVSPNSAETRWRASPRFARSRRNDSSICAT